MAESDGEALPWFIPGMLLPPVPAEQPASEMAVATARVVMVRFFLMVLGSFSQSACSGTAAWDAHSKPTAWAARQGGVLCSGLAARCGCGFYVRLMQRSPGEGLPGRCE
ncbi:hypothetical protein GCM10023346_39990 [Arthrobacter gyeryongensis]|uniref:Uncharacterized protein n=1 Tax=Arthrobacter gyeryongensis TaxID=1650592 RepID=A0ABP9SNF1_9MICC